MNHRTIQPMSTLENFGYVELDKLNDLIYAYRHAGDYVQNGKYYAPLPSTWDDCGVYPDFNPSSGLVFLTNENYDALVLTEHGVMQWYYTSYNGYEGTIFDLADKIIDYLSDDAGNPLPYSKISSYWDKEELNDVYSWLNSCISDLEHVKADKSDLYRAKDLIVYGFILDHLPAAADKFKENNEDWYLQLDDDEYFEETLIPMFIEQLLGDLEQGFSDDETIDYALFIREEMIAYLK